MAIARNNNRGEVMVEAVVYFPIVCFVLLLFICIGVMKVQNALTEYGVDKKVDQLAKYDMYEGYEYLDGAKDNSFRLSVAMPSEGEVTAEHLRRQELSTLYHQNINYGLASECTRGLATVLRNYSLVRWTSYTSIGAFGSSNYTSRPEITYKRQLFFLPMFSKLGAEKADFSGKAYSYGTSPVELIRKTDISATSAGINERGIMFGKLLSDLSMMRCRY